jgi:hypothetical protein
MVGGPDRGEDRLMRTICTAHPARSALAAAVLLVPLVLGACGGDDDGGSSGGPTTAAPAEGGSSDASLDEALADAAPDATVEVPSEDGAVSIADFRSGERYDDVASPDDLAMVFAVVTGVSGSDIDGYITDDAVVVRVDEADIAVLCGAIARVDTGSRTVIPVRPDGTGVDCG